MLEHHLSLMVRTTYLLYNCILRYLKIKSKMYCNWSYNTCLVCFTTWNKVSIIGGTMPYPQRHFLTGQTKCCVTLDIQLMLSYNYYRIWYITISWLFCSTFSHYVFGFKWGVPWLNNNLIMSLKVLLANIHTKSDKWLLRNV